MNWPGDESIWIYLTGKTMTFHKGEIFPHSSVISRSIWGEGPQQTPNTLCTLSIDFWFYFQWTAPNVKTWSSGSSVNMLCSWAGWRCWNIWTSLRNADWPDSPKSREWTEWRVWSSNLGSSSVSTSKLYTYLAENKRGWLLRVHTFMAQVWTASRTIKCARDEMFW